MKTPKELIMEAAEALQAYRDGLAEVEYSKDALAWRQRRLAKTEARVPGLLAAAREAVKRLEDMEVLAQEPPA